LHDFFTFCGTISSIDYKEKEGEATISFEKPNAAKTALILNGGALDGSTLAVTSDVVHQDEEHQPTPGTYEQSDKPRAGSGSWLFSFINSPFMVYSQLRPNTSQRVINYLIRF
jgi:hypothetical protein